MQSAVQSAVQSADDKSNLYIPVCHTSRRPIKNAIGAVVNRLVGMALYTTFSSVVFIPIDIFFFFFFLLKNIQFRVSPGLPVIYKVVR